MGYPKRKTKGSVDCQPEWARNFRQERCDETCPYWKYCQREIKVLTKKIWKKQKKN